MGKKICKTVLLCCLIWEILFMYSNAEGISSNKNEDETTIAELQIEKVVPPEEAIECLNNEGAMTIAHNLRDPEFFHISDFSFDDIQIMEPFVVYMLQQDGMFNHNDIYYFPVVSNQKVLFTLDIFLNDVGEYQCGSTVNGERLTELMGNGGCNRIYVDYGANFKSAEYKVIQVDSDTRINAETSTYQTFNDIKKQNIQVLKDISSDVLLEYNQLMNQSKETEVNSRSTQYLYERLDMSYCLVSQADYDCGIPCIATIYRYRTGDRSMTSASLDVLNKNVYKCNIRTTAGQVKLLNSLMPVAIQNQYKEAWINLSHFVVQHNINNKFPILFGGTNLRTGGVHCFVLHGYETNSQGMRWYFFNPWGEDTVTPFNPDGTTYIVTSMGNSWRQSGGSCLLLP
ncbi:MAG: hypothetical protein MSG78_07930 [Clostridiales bacterium]|nr:hypothetical protein [Clostridiales bacterium]